MSKFLNMKLKIKMEFAMERLAGRAWMIIKTIEYTPPLLIFSWKESLVRSSALDVTFFFRLFHDK